MLAIDTSYAEEQIAARMLFYCAWDELEYRIDTGIDDPRLTRPGHFVGDFLFSLHDRVHTGHRFSSKQRACLNNIVANFALEDVWEHLFGWLR